MAQSKTRSGDGEETTEDTDGEDTFDTGGGGGGGGPGGGGAPEGGGAGGLGVDPLREGLGGVSAEFMANFPRLRELLPPKAQTDSLKL